MNNANDGSFGNGLNLASLITFYIVTLISYSYLFYISLKNNILKLNKRTTIVFIFALVTFIYLMLVSSITRYDNFYSLDSNSISNLNRVSSIMDTSIMCLFVFTLFTCLPNLKEKDLMMRFFSFGLLIFAFSAIIYSLINEFDVYRTLIPSNGFFTENTIYAYSFFKYGNVYGHLIYFGFLCLLYLGYSYKKWWIYLISILFGFLIIFSGCRGGFICYLFTLYFLSFYLVYFLYKKNKIVSFISLFIILGFAIWLALEIFLIKSIKVPYKILENDEYIIVYKDLHYIVDIMVQAFFKERDIIFKTLLNLINNYQIIFGLGIDNLDYVIRIIHGDFNLHNGFYTIYFTGGVFFSLIYIFIFIITLLKLFKIIKFDKRFFILYIVILLPSLLYQLSESYPPMFPVFGGGVMGMLLIASINLKYIELEEKSNICRFI